MSSSPATATSEEVAFHVTSTYTIPTVDGEPILHKFSVEFKGGLDDDGFFILRVQAEGKAPSNYPFEMKTCQKLMNQLGHVMDLAATNSVRRRLEPKFKFQEPKITEEKLTSPVKKG
jgi:hypothetical protein